MNGVSLCRALRRSDPVQVADHDSAKVARTSSSPPEWYAEYLRDAKRPPPRNRRVPAAKERSNTIWKAGTDSTYYTNIARQPRWWTGVVQLNGRDVWVCKHHHDEQWPAVSCARERLTRGF